MALRTGIKVSDTLSKVLSDAKNGDIRIIRVSVVNETLVETKIVKVKGSFKEDYAGVEESLDGDVSSPAYILVRLGDAEKKVESEEKSAGGEEEGADGEEKGTKDEEKCAENEEREQTIPKKEERSESTKEVHWLLLTYVPDNAKVRDRMIYGSSSLVLKKVLGDQIADSIHATQRSDLEWSGYERHERAKSAKKPWTQRELELAEVKKAEAAAATEYSSSARKTYAPGITFPLTEDATGALEELNKPAGDRQHNFVSLRLVGEKIELDKKETAKPADVKGHISRNEPRYTFFVYPHDESKESAVFIYTCPPSSKIREKMLYASNRANVIERAKNETNVNVDKKIETSDPEDITEKYLEEELKEHASSASSGGIGGERHQMLGSTSSKFSRPIAPGRKPTAVPSQE